MRIPTFNQFQRQANLLSREMDKYSRLHQHTISDNKLLNSSEDPVAAGQIKNSETTLAVLQNYFDNSQFAKTRSGLISISTQNANNIMQSIQDAIKQAQNGTLSDGDRKSIAEQLVGQLNNLLSVANSQDPINGQYLFSGASVQTPPYVQSNGVYQYQGSMETVSINVAPSVSALYNESGFQVFSDIYTGNGTFTVQGAPTNQGGATLSSGVVSSPGQYIADEYTVSFATNTAGKLVYTISGAASGQVVPPPPGTVPDDAPVYTSGAAITFNGISVTAQGTPNVSDVFTIAPSSKENVFNSLQNVINLLKNPITNKANYEQEMWQHAATFHQISDHLIAYQATAGARDESIDSQIKINQDRVLNQTIALSQLKDPDMAKTNSEFMQESVILQVTIQSYMKVQETLNKLLQLN